MDHFYIITNDIKDRNLEVTGQISDYLTGHGKRVTINSECIPGNGEYHYTDARTIPDDTDCIIVLGGDGTLLQAARDMVGKDLPLLGINLGRLGYLAEIDRNMIIPAMDQLLKGDFSVEKRMMLTGTVEHKGKEIARDLALNDIVITRESAIGVVNYSVSVNGVAMASYLADGVIVATPTGSTGYSLSAGGPIVSPQASLLLVTAVAPHMLNTRSIVLPSDDAVTVEIGPGRDGREEKAVVSFDGDTSIHLVEGDRITVRKAHQDTKIIKISHQSFLDTLRKKMKNT